MKQVDGASGNYLLDNGTGEYQYGTDLIRFGPGIAKHTKLTGLDGELYNSHFGTLRTDGMHVYCTGITPFEHMITIG